jgi:hypothetical protein
MLTYGSQLIIISVQVAGSIPHWPLPAVCDLTRDGRLSTYDESVLKLSKVSFRGKCARTGHPLKLPSPTKPARLGHFPPASQAGRVAGPVFYAMLYIFSLAGLHGTVLDFRHVLQNAYNCEYNGRRCTR